MPAPATASGMTVSLPGGISASDVFSFSISTSGPSAIDITPIGQTAGTTRTYAASPIGLTYEASISFFGSGEPSVGSKGTVSIGDVSFYGVCTSASASASVNDVARYEATYRQISSS